MTSLTIELPEDLVKQAQLAGLLNQQFLSATLSSLLIKKIKQKQAARDWQDFFKTIDQLGVSEDFLSHREQPPVQESALH